MQVDPRPVLRVFSASKVWGLAAFRYRDAIKTVCMNTGYEYGLERAECRREELPFVFVDSVCDMGLMPYVALEIQC